MPHLEKKIIIEGLKELLPGYAVPRCIIFGEIPKNNMGKINKVQLESIVRENI